MATSKEAYAKKSKAEMFHILRREILAARLKVTLDKKRKRPTSDKIRRLAAMELPPIIRESDSSAQVPSSKGSAQTVPSLVSDAIDASLSGPLAEFSKLGSSLLSFQNEPSILRTFDGPHDGRTVIMYVTTDAAHHDYSRGTSLWSGELKGSGQESNK